MLAPESRTGPLRTVIVALPLEEQGRVHMPDFRLYRMNRYSGHIEGVEELHSADDVEAICLVRHRAGPEPLELWCGGRKVIRIDAIPEIAPSSVRIDA